MERALKAERRDHLGKGGARKIRAAGRVPAVVYGHGDEALHLTVDARELFHLLHTDAGMNVMVDLNVDGDTLLAMPREVQRDHIKGQFVHIDFLRIARDETVTVEVPVHLTGDARGVREGGVIEHHLWTVQLEALPGSVPTAIDADVTNLGINDSLKVSDLTVPPEVTLLTSEDEVIVTVVPPQVLRAAEEVLEATEGEAVEPSEAEASPVEEPQPGS